MIGAIFGILAALLIGLSDLFGRQVTAKSSAITAASTMQAFGAASVLISLLFWPGTFSSSDLALGALSGVGFAVGLSSYYLGLTRASSAVVAPLAAVLSALIPFGWVVVGGTEVSPLSAIGANIHAVVSRTAPWLKPEPPSARAQVLAPLTAQYSRRALNEDFKCVLLDDPKARRVPSQKCAIRREFLGKNPSDIF